MQTDPEKMTDEQVVALAAAERDAGVPDMQTAAAAADAKERIANAGDEDDQAEAHPS